MGKARGKVSDRNRPEGMSTATELARHLGVTPADISAARKRGLVPDLVDAADRAWYRIPEAADRYNAITRRRTTVRSMRAQAQQVAPLEAGASPPTPTEVDQRPGGPERLPGETYEQARLRLTVAEANKRELEVATKRGELIPREAVLTALGAAATVLKDGLSAFGSRFAQQLANEPDPRRCKEIIDDGARALLVGMRTDLERKLPALRDGATP